MQNRRNVFFTDLDNTIIYSYKRDIGSKKKNVERYQGREISFITERTCQLLKRIKENILMVPVSTRTIEQYQRIDLGIGDFEYALVCNGGILLKNGVNQTDWYAESLSMIADSREELSLAKHMLEKDERRYFELRFIENLFLFTKCHEHEEVVKDLKKELGGEYADVFDNGDKVYVVPKKLSKGMAVERFKKYMGIDFSIAAGDSEFDVSMLEKVDVGFVPYGFSERFPVHGRVTEAGRDGVFSDEFLFRCLKEITREV